MTTRPGCGAERPLFCDPITLKMPYGTFLYRAVRHLVVRMRDGVLLSKRAGAAGSA